MEPYLQHYLNYPKDAGSISVSTEDVSAVVDLLCRYGLLWRYYPGKGKTQMRDYTRFYVQDALRPVYLDRVTQERIKENEILNRKHEQAIKAGQMKEKTIQKEQVKKEVEEHLKALMPFMQQEFHLSEAYLKTEGLGWQYAAHCLQILAHYQTNHDGKLTIADVPKVLLFINPVLNLSMHAGCIREIDLLYQAVKHLFDNLQPSQTGISSLPQLSTVTFNEEGEPKAQKDWQAITQFCDALAARDEVYKDKPMLPALYAEFIYYYARRCFKAEMSEGIRQQCEYDIQVAHAMRKVIDKHPHWQNVPRMNHDTVTFQQDGLGLMWIMRETKPDLERAYKLYSSGCQDNDKRQASKCNRYLADIECRLVKEAFDSNGLNALATLIDSKGNKVPKLLQEAKEHLKVSKNLLEDDSITNKLYLKDKRYYVIMMQLQYLRARWYQAEANRASNNKKPYIDLHEKYLNKAASNAHRAIRLCGVDQRNDIFESHACLANIYQDFAALAPLNGEKLHYLKAALHAIGESINLQQDIKTYRYDRKLLYAYAQQVTIQQQVADILCRRKEYEMAEKHTADASVILSKLIRVADKDLQSPLRTQYQELLKRQAELQALRNRVELAQQEQEQEEIKVMRKLTL